MSFDTIASLQRMQQLQQSEAAAGNKLILKRVDSTTEIVITVLDFALAIFTFGISIRYLVFNKRTYS
nr:hypothetical protein [Bacillus cereus]